MEQNNYTTERSKGKHRNNEERIKMVAPRKEGT